jgi:hypothetical protein
MDAQLLDAHLNAAGGKRLRASAFQREAAAMRRAPWTLATGVDYRYEKTQGPRRGWPALLAQRYVDGVTRLACQREDTYRSLLHVMHMTATPVSLLAPKIAVRVAFDVLMRPRKDCP